jgi:hypothetical protein
MTLSTKELEILQSKKCIFCQGELDSWEINSYHNKGYCRNCPYCDGKYKHYLSYSLTYTPFTARSVYILEIIDNSHEDDDDDDDDLSDDDEDTYIYCSDAPNVIEYITADKYNSTNLHFDLICFANNRNIDEAVEQIKLLNLFS